MNIQQQLDAVISKWNLLNHPFYQAWSNGTLPIEKLKTYASEYAGFINTVAAGWEACGNIDIANIERGHYQLWKQFANSLGNTTVTSTLPAVKKLVTACDINNASLSSALGSLYAFEAQQPYTAKSKLEGLRKHYADIKCDETYFELHENDFDEPAMLVNTIETLTTAQQQQAVSVCEDVCEKLWHALTAIHGDTMC